MAQLVKNPSATWETCVQSLGWEDSPGDNVGDLRSVPRLGRSPGERNSYPLQYSSLENSVDYMVPGVAESDTTERLSVSFKHRYDLDGNSQTCINPSCEMILECSEGGLKQ